MFDFFDKIVGFLEVLWNIIENFISTAFTLCGFLISAASLPAKMVFFAPSIIVTGMTVFIGIALLKFLVGR